MKRYDKPSRVAARTSIVKSSLGDSAAIYLKNKNKGGANGNKGSRYEDVFAVFLAAESAKQSWPTPSNEVLEGQAEAYFVDDLVVSNPANASIVCYQLKNSPSVTWKRGKNPIAKDFDYQYRLSQEEGFKTICTTLVTSDLRRAELLKTRIPASHRKFTKVRWFPWETSLHQLCSSHRSALEPISWLSKHEEPSSAELMETLCVILSAWIASESSGAQIAEVIDKARQISPTMLRPQLSDADAANLLDEKFIDILTSFDKFTYSIVRGFFRWEISHTNGAKTRSTCLHDCSSEAFDALQKRIIARKPATIDQLEEELR